MLHHISDPCYQSNAVVPQYMCALYGVANMIQRHRINDDNEGDAQ